METIIVVSILSITLLILFASYSTILEKSKERNRFDTTDTIYKVYYLKKILDSYHVDSSTYDNNILEYMALHDECKPMRDTNSTYALTSLDNDSFECVVNDSSPIKKQANIYQIDKFYLLKPSSILNSNESNEWLNLFDATTIDYINKLGKADSANLFVIKYKYNYEDSYEVFHASLEV